MSGRELLLFFVLQAYIYIASQEEDFVEMMQIDASQIHTLAIPSLFGILSACLGRGADNVIMAQVSSSDKNGMTWWNRTKIREVAIGKECKGRQKNETKRKYK